MHCSRYHFSAKNNSAGAVFILLLLSVQFPSGVLGQVDSAKSDSKPRIIFKNQSTPDTAGIHSSQSDSGKLKIIFRNQNAVRAGRIEIISSEQFKVNGEIYTLGESGISLKRAMAANPRASGMVESAYGKRGTGTALMVAGVAIAVAGYFLPSTWVKLNEEKHQTYSETWYWFPGVTAGVIVGGIGYVQYSSLTSRLKDAIDYYNRELLTDEQGK